VDWISLALGDDRGCVAILNRSLGRPIGQLVDEDAVDWRTRLHPCCRVDDIAGRDALPGLGVRVERDQCLSGRDPDPDLTLSGELVADGQRGPDCPLGVVLVRDRRPKHRHDRVADELLHRAAVALEHRSEVAVIRLKKPSHLLRVHSLRARGEADEVGEQHRDDLAFLARRCRVRGEGGSAGVTKASASRVLLTAVRAGDHWQSVRRRLPRLLALCDVGERHVSRPPGIW
jgi:hypothetical protein